MFYTYSIYYNRQAHFKQCSIDQKFKFMCPDISNFYLNNHIDKYEYMKLSLDIVQDETIQK